MKLCRYCSNCIIIDKIIICEKHKSKGIIIPLNCEKLDIPCHADKPIDRYLLENEFINPDKEVDFGYIEDCCLD